MIEITRPLMTLLDEFGEPVEGVSKSASEVEAMERASRLPDGTYYLERPSAKIVVDRAATDTDTGADAGPEPEPEPSGNAVILLRDDFTGGKSDAWSQQPSNAQVPETGIIDTPPGETGDWFRLRTRKEDWPPAVEGATHPRAQIADYEHLIEQGTHYWIGFDLFLELAWQNETRKGAGCQIWQVHGLNAINNVSHLCGQFEANVFQCLNREGKFGALNNDVLREVPWDSPLIPKGRKFKHVLHLCMSYEGDGIIEYWIDDVLFARKTGPNMWYGLNDAPKSKSDLMAFVLMLYKPKIDEDSTAATEHTAWFDKFTMARVPSDEDGYSVVDPDLFQ